MEYVSQVSLPPDRDLKQDFWLRSRSYIQPLDSDFGTCCSYSVDRL